MTSLQTFINILEEQGQLVRVTQSVSPELEITEIADRVCKGPEKHNKAVLFENVQGYEMPVLINMFGNAERMAMALHVHTLEDLNNNLARLIDLKPWITVGQSSSCCRSSSPHPKKSSCT